MRISFRIGDREGGGGSGEVVAMFLRNSELEGVSLETQKQDVEGDTKPIFLCFRSKQASELYSILEKESCAIGFLLLLDS
ncbi:hypothetical protein E2542_SST04002 [Spatholobus suberectus]|nr:hypothetical protein E2542_SST04002 [Spatholobus suberectus]